MLWHEATEIFQSTREAARLELEVEWVKVKAQ
jgi:hypothetical protein